MRSGPTSGALIFPKIFGGIAPASSPEWPGRHTAFWLIFASKDARQRCSGSNYPWQII